MAEDRRVCVAIFGAPHGVKGQVKLISYTENPETIFTYHEVQDAHGRPVSFHRVGVVKGQYIVSLDVVRDRNQAQLLKGTKLYVDRDALPEPDEGEFYQEDLIGLSVQHAQTKEVLGQVHHVSNYGAGDVVDIRFADGVEESFLFDAQTFPEILLEQGVILFLPPEYIEAKED